MIVEVTPLRCIIQRRAMAATLTLSSLAIARNSSRTFHVCSTVFVDQLVSDHPACSAHETLYIYQIQNR